MKLILVQCHADAIRDSKGDTVDAGPRVAAELRTGGRLGLFATGGRLVERERPDEAPPLLVTRDDFERDDAEREVVDPDDDGVACERVPRCELSGPVMVIRPRLLSSDRTRQAAIQYEPRRQNRLCPLLLLLQRQQLSEYLPCELENSERDP